MKTTGITRRIDRLGRVVLPMELRRNLSIEENDPIEIFLEDDKIVLKKYEAANQCFVTGEVHKDNIPFLNGTLTLSKKGAEILLEKLMEVDL